MGWDGYQELLLVLDQIAKRHGVSISHVASKYILDQEGVGAAIVGIRNSRHVESNTKIFEFDLDKEEMEKIKDLIEQYQILDGEPFELERTVGSKYRNIMKMNLSEELSE